MIDQTEVTILAHSAGEAGPDLVTLYVRFPRIILAEFNTHRVMSRNFRSSRAVPIHKLAEEVRNSPYVPKVFTSNRPGMQGGEPLTGRDADRARHWWLASATRAAHYAEQVCAEGAHKQHANRILEPYLYVDGVVTANQWDNFFNLRCHEDAQPDFQILAKMIESAISNSTPTVLPASGAWHLPYVTSEDRHELRNAGFDAMDFVRLSAVRCARVSYKPFDGVTAGRKELAMLSKLDPPGGLLHASPFEHQARACFNSDRWANFPGWEQYRRQLEDRDE